MTIRSGLTAAQLIGLVADPGSFDCWDGPVAGAPADEAYEAALARARARTGLDEAVTTGRGLVGGRPVALVVSEFGFLGGSIGVATAERITRAVERATAERLPLLALPVSGGTRMQEGSAAFLCMVRITAAVQAHQAAALPYLTYLRSPTMGGVFASWGTLGQLVLAEPGARLGFLGPRVYEELRGVRLPEEVQRAETLAAQGLIDAVLPPTGLPGFLGRVLALLDRRAPQSQSPSQSPSQSRSQSRSPAGAPTATGPAQVDTQADTRADAWESVRLTRRPGRPGARELLARTAEGALPLTAPGGRHDGQDDGRGGALVRALAEFGGRAAVVVGQQRQDPGTERPFTAADLRCVQRTARLAEQLGLPLVTVVDTAGAELSTRAELEGVALEIAHCLNTLIALRTPVLAVLLGQGSGGGALALLPADRVLAAEHAWLAPLPPEGASAIVHRDGEHAAELARAQGIGAYDLAAAGLVDEVLPEHPDAAEESDAFCDRVGRAIGRALAELAAQSEATRTTARARRNRRLGSVQ
ncbi:carboxyl transferase domain-containing protein [Kitasatospora sp. GP82]|uniref:carboxyl transferase domain-containing protein n=1 Tax=Kitasatospora sp. GP82 TaxID=3035089 RepID=UPI0024738CFA|nr:carboxyl transferase domain-containing protein [Kitasatospora sp. GP82]MDH6127967.1 acetyl-CoA carboxylase beta subunit/acetyl-CoA carboxylase alpha subunit [Kitasatospora sp. GP82]